MGKQVLVAQKRSGIEIDLAAEKVIREYKPEILTKPQAFDVQRYLDCELEERTGIAGDYQMIQGGVHGYTDIEEMKCVICKSLSDDPQNRRFLRSTIGHELGHCFLHVPEFRRRKQLARFINKDENAVLQRRAEDNIPTCAHPEWQAYRFSGALLIPRSSLEIALARGASEHELCEIYDVHAPFLQSRLRALKLA